MLGWDHLGNRGSPGLSVVCRLQTHSPRKTSRLNVPAPHPHCDGSWDWPWSLERLAGIAR